MPWEKLRFRLTLLVTVFCVCSGLSSAQQNATDLDGHAVDPFATDASKIVVLVFVRSDCPVSSRYAPAIQQISRHYAERASFWLVFPDKSETPQAIRNYLEEYGYRLPALRDLEHALVKLGHTQITPEVAVFDSSHRLVYDGRIDDWYVDLGRARSAPTTHELADAIRAALAGSSVAKSEVRGVGCYISDLN